MTYEDFVKRYCDNKCGTQSCLARPQDLSYCDYYQGDIEGIPKIKSLMEQFEEWMGQAGITWEDLRIEYEQGKKEEAKIKSIRASFNGHFYIDVDENASEDDINKHIEEYVSELEECIDPHAVIDEYNWSEINN